MTSLFNDVRSGAVQLRDDKRGAVMLTGLFLSFFLVGALWYVIGVGDAIIFRDRMQEASDSAVFSSAAVHAKGMNFISVCNILMLLMALVHIVMGIIQDVTILACLSIYFSLAACPKVPGAIKNFHNVSDKMKKLMTATATVSSAIALGTPWAGTARGVSIGRNYGNQGRIKDVTALTMGASNFPGVVSGNGVFLKKAIPLGLPVQGEPYNMLCEKIGQDLFSAIGSIIPIPFGRFLDDVIGNAAGSLLKFRYCNDMGQSSGTADILNKVRNQRKDVNDELRNGNKQTEARNRAGGDQNGQLGIPGIEDFNPDSDMFNVTQNGGRRNEEEDVNGWSPWFDPGFDAGWGDPGVLVVQDDAGNGKFAHQIWAVNMNPKYLDTNERPVSVASTLGKNGGSVSKDVEKGSTFFGYFAQAEFYYDCDEEWGDDKCDGDDHNTAFGMNWRARLRGLQVPNLFNLIGKLVNGGVRGIIEKVMDKAFNGNAVMKALGRSAAGSIAIDAISGWIEDKLITPYISDPITNGVQDAIDGMQPGLQGSYH